MATISTDKIYEYKIFDPATGSYLMSIPNVISDFGYNQDINTAGNPITIELGQTADVLAATLHNIITESTSENIDTEDSQDLLAVTDTGAQVGDGSNINLNYHIEVWLYYGYEDVLVDENGVEVVDENGVDIAATVGSPDGMTLFKGYISDFSARYGQNETTLLTCLPYGADLDQYVIKSGANTSVAYNSYDPSDIVRAVLDNFVAQGGTTTYTTSSIQETFTIASYPFKLNTILEGIKAGLTMAPSNWYWYVDVATNTVVFKARPTSVTHTFILDKHIENIVVTKSMLGIKNNYYFVGGDINDDPANPNYLFKHYTDTTSIAAYRPGLGRDTDQRVTDPSSADIIGNSYIATNKDPRYQATITVLTNVYDIETIELGQLVGFSNFGNYIDNLQLEVVGRSYTPDAVTLKLDTVLPQPSKRLEDIKRNLTQTIVSTIPDTPS